METFGGATKNTNEGAGAQLGMEGLYKRARNLKVFLENRKNKIPPTEFDFFFSPHGSAEDFRGLRERVEASDIFLCERHGWDPELLHTYEMCSSHGFSPNTANLADFSLDFSDPGLLGAIRGTKKPVRIIDVPLKEINYDNDFDLGQFEGLLKVSNTFNEDVLASKVEELLKQLAMETQQREEYMMEHIQVMMKDVLKNNKQLLNGENLKISIWAGSAHGALKMAMENEGIKTKVSSPEIKKMSFFMEMVDLARMNKIDKIDIPTSKKLLLHFLLERFLRERLIAFVPPDFSSRRVLGLVRGALDLFSQEEIDEIFKQETIYKKRVLLNKKLEQKGFDIKTAFNSEV